VTGKIGIWEHFRKLASFQGREDRASFWPYAALVLGIVMVAGALMVLLMMAQLIRVAPPQSIPAQAGFAEPVFPVDFFTAYLAVTVGLAVLLYAAAVFRRLHDCGKSGAWGLMPLPFLAYTSVQSVLLVDSLSRGGQPNPTLFLTIAASNILFWAALLALVVLLAGASDPEPNAYD
jgi:uncharacterized membrane protein YhaH (DUF805 family)